MEVTERRRTGPSWMLQADPQQGPFRLEICRTREPWHRWASSGLQDTGQVLRISTKGTKMCAMTLPRSLDIGFLVQKK